MPVEINEIGPCKKRIKVTVAKERVTQEIEKNYREVAHTIALPGFRKGRVPRHIIEKRFGKSIEHEIEQNLIQSTLNEALEENKLLPIGEPKLENHEFDKSKDPALAYEATVAVRPEFALPDLAGLTAEKAAIVATDQEIAESLEQSRRARGELIPKAEAEPIGPEDAIIADVEFLADGAVKRTEEGGHIWLKNDRVGPVKVEGLAAKAAGKKAGDAIEFAAELPASLGVEGGNTAIRLKVKEVKTAKMPALDDAFAQESGFENLKEMREEVRSRMLRAKDEQAEREVEEKLVEGLVSRVQFELPEDLVDQELDELALRAQMRAKYLGKSEEDAAAEAGKIRGASREEVVRRLKGVFLLDKIAREHKIFATEDEVGRAIAQMAERYNRSFDEVMKELDQSGAVARLRHDLRMDKARKFVRSKAAVAEK
jgi:trigger factor